MWWLEMVRKECLRRGYSKETIKTYNQCLQRFFKYYKGDINRVKKDDVKNYLDFLISNGRTGSTLNVHLSALKFLYSDILNKRLIIKVKYSKLPKRLPRSLSKEEIILLINSIKNMKHKLMITLLYSAGLRVSELLNLKVEDIKEDYGWVRQGKGNKDRQFIIADSIKVKLTNYIEGKQGFIFTNNKGKRLSTSTVREILKIAAKKSNLNHVHPHLLRHSFGTHVINDGYSVTELQPLMGHHDTRTTYNYVHANQIILTRVKSPLDTL
jgi:integrase/recombinase XerD